MLAIGMVLQSPAPSQGAIEEDQVLDHPSLAAGKVVLLAEERARRHETNKEATQAL